MQPADESLTKKMYVKHKQQQVEANVFSALSEKTLRPLEILRRCFIVACCWERSGCKSSLQNETVFIFFLFGQERIADKVNKYLRKKFNWSSEQKN